MNRTVYRNCARCNAEITTCANCMVNSILDDPTSVTNSSVDSSPVDSSSVDSSLNPSRVEEVAENIQREIQLIATKFDGAMKLLDVIRSSGQCEHQISTARHADMCRIVSDTIHENNVHIEDAMREFSDTMTKCFPDTLMDCILATCGHVRESNEKINEGVSSTNLIKDMCCEILEHLQNFKKRIEEEELSVDTFPGDQTDVISQQWDELLGKSADTNTQIKDLREAQSCLDNKISLIATRLDDFRKMCDESYVKLCERLDVVAKASSNQQSPMNVLNDILYSMGLWKTYWESVSQVDSAVLRSNMILKIQSVIDADISGITNKIVKHPSLSQLLPSISEFKIQIMSIDDTCSLAMISSPMALTDNLINLVTRFAENLPATSQQIVLTADQYDRIEQQFDIRDKLANRNAVLAEQNSTLLEQNNYLTAERDRLKVENQELIEKLAAMEAARESDLIAHINRKFAEMNTAVTACRLAIMAKDE